MLEFLRQPITFKRTPKPDTGEDASAAMPAADAPVPAPSEHKPERAPRRKHGPRAGTLTGLDIQPGLVVAARSHLNGGIQVERAAFLPIGMDVVRDGEVADIPALVTVLAELFKESRLDRRVRIGIANQRIIMRRIELPPLTDPAEIRQAVQFQAQDEIPMPLETVVLDHHALGIIEREEGPRLQVLLVAARREMVERILQAARLAGLQPEGVDLAAFGMIRALHPAGSNDDDAVAYLSVGGLTNLAIARGLTCEFTRVISAGVEQVAADVAARCGVSTDEARRLLVAPEAPAQAQNAGTQPGELVGAAQESTAPAVDKQSIARHALNEGLRRIGSEVRNSLDFYLAAPDSAPVTRAVLTGSALEIPGFTESLSHQLGIPVDRGELDPAGTGVPASVLPVAAGLSLAEGLR